MSNQAVYDLEHRNLFDLLQKLDQRITQVERAMQQGSPPAASAGTISAASSAEETRRSGLELKIGEFGLAWFGSVILLLGIAFLMTYIHGLGLRLVAGCLGFAAALGFYLASRAGTRSNPYLSNLMAGGSVVLVFYASVRLHYFTAQPLIRHDSLAFAILLGVVAIAITLAVKRSSESGFVMAVVLGVVASLLSPQAPTGLALITVLALIASAMTVRRGWWTAVIATSLLVYCSHMLWLLNNPVAGREMRSIAAEQYSLIFLFVCGAAFFWPALARASSSQEGSLTLTLFNCAGFFVILGMAAYALYSRNYGPAFLAGAGFFLGCSVVQWLHTRKQLAPAIYACSGYLALSIGISGHAQPPTLFLWLALQSLAVVCTALWFRSKILVVVNSVIFLAILLAYVSGFPSSNWVNFSFALVAHASARIMNWQKERLTLQTDMLRNVYLVVGFIFVLYGLAHALPAHYVTLSWVGAAATYFLVSIVLDNYKYRWLAVASVLVTIVYLLAVDLPQLDAKYRVPAFLAVGLITLVISMYYARFRPAPGGKS